MRGKIAIWITVLIVLSVTALAIDVSPPRVVLENVPKQATVQKSVILSGIDPGSAISISTQGEGSGWVTSTLGEAFTYPQVSTLEIPFKITIPNKAPNGEYHVRAQIVASSPIEEGSSGSRAEVSVGVFVDIMFSVTGEQVEDYHITSVTIPTFETGNDLLVVLKVNNKGNILVRPSNIDIITKDKTKEEELFTGSQVPTKSVEPFSVGEIVTPFKQRLVPGQYFADVSIDMKAGKTEEKNIPFDVVEQGTINSKGTLQSLHVDENVEEIAKITAVFQNTGGNDLYVTLKGDVYLTEEGKQSLQGTIESETEFIPKGAQKELVHYHTIKKEGEYELQAHIEFGSQKTETKKVTFTASKEGNQKNQVSEKGTDISTTTLILIGVITLLVFVIITMFILMKKGK